MQSSTGLRLQLRTEGRWYSPERRKVIKQNQLEEFADDFIREPIVITAADHAERLTCRKCGKQYVSRGKHDFGICRDCEAKETAIMIGGPLDGKKAYEIKS